MIYIQINASDKDVANQWVIDNCDPLATETFIVNKQDEIGNEYCLISLSNDDSEYNQKMIDHFGIFTESQQPISENATLATLQDIPIDNPL